MWLCDVAVQLNSSLARPHDLTCQVCEKHCADEVRFFCHIHKYHPDYWRVFSGGRPLSDFIESTSPDSEQSSSPPRRGSPGPCPPTSSSGREKRYSCSVCHKRYCNQTGYVKHMAAHPGLANDLLRAGDAARMALYNCVVCSKLFTKEAYLLRHMEMKLDPAHAVGLEQLKKSSAMFRSTTETTTATAMSLDGGGGCRPSSSYAVESHASRSASVDDVEGDNDRVASSPGTAGMPTRYVDDSRPGPSDALRRSTSCVSPLSTSSESPASPPPMTSFMPYSAAAGIGRDEPRRVPPAAFMPDTDVLRYRHPIASAAAAAAAAADYHLRRGIVDVGYTHSPSSTPSYRAPPLPAPPRSPTVDEDVQPGSPPDGDDRRASYAGPERRRYDYYTSTSSTFNRFQPYASPPLAATSSSVGVTGTAATPPFVSSSYRIDYSFYRPDDTAQAPPHLSDTYMRCSSSDLDDRRPLHRFR